MNEHFPHPSDHISNTTPLEYFQKGMAPVRQQMASGGTLKACIECRTMERHGKISGRQRQLLKTGVSLDKFAPTMTSSPWLKQWRDSINDSTLITTPQDWQVELGNYCNSGCVFCKPTESSRLAVEFKKLGIEHEPPPKNWSDDPVLVERFIESLVSSPKVRYVHFIGGETVIMPAFKRILEAMVEHGLHETAAMGFTTNMTVWPEDVIELTAKFKEVNLGLSIETMTNLNDYVRWPSDINSIKEILQKWVELGHSRKWLTTLRVTPTVLTVHELWTVYQYAIDNDVNVESCNFLHTPRFMRPTVLPRSKTYWIADHLENWVTQQKLQTEKLVINQRNPQFRRDATLQDALSYVNYLRTADDETNLLPELVAHLKKLESSRNNNILNYLPEYANLFRSVGY